MAEQVTVTGILVGAEARPYRGFDSSDGPVPAGVTRWLHVSRAFNEEPVRIKVRNPFASEFDQLALLGPGHVVAVTCSLYANGNRIERQYVAHQVVASPDGEVAGNGSKPVAVGR